MKSRTRFQDRELRLANQRSFQRKMLREAQRLNKPPFNLAVFRSFLGPGPLGTRPDLWARAKFERRG